MEKKFDKNFKTTYYSPFWTHFTDFLAKKNFLEKLGCQFLDFTANERFIKKTSELINGRTHNSDFIGLSISRGPILPS